MKTKKNLMKLSLITVAMMSYCTFVSAQGNSSELDTINVNGSYSSEDVKQKKVGETVKTAKELNKQQVQDSRDLVRYETGVTVVEAGRFGSSGYAIRGVDENRVAITVDGLHQSETLSSQGFKELFEGYGNFNNTRNSVEIETLKQVSINRGSNSIKVGSGALGGAVIFETKDARDLLIDKDWHISYKKGYNTADNQNMDTITLAGRYKWFDAMVVKTKRNGHELENYGYKTYNSLLQGKTREKADPYEINKDSTLIKLSFSPNENHRIAFTYDDFKNHINGHDFSYILNDGSEINYDSQSLRHTKDKSTRRNIAFSYENYVSTPLWDTLKVSYSEQKITNRARTDDYCDGDNCSSIANPLGLDIKDGQFVDKNGDPLTLKLHEGLVNSIFGSYMANTQHVVDKNGVPFENGTAFNAKRLSEFWFDCSIFNCDSPISVYSYNYTNEEPVKKEVNLTTKHEFNGKTFATNLGENKTYVIIPNSPGYLKTFYRERDLNTQTKQLNLDFTKQLTVFNVDNQFEYGASYVKTKKEMVNKEGYYGSNPQWWVPQFPGMKNDTEVKSCADISYEPWTICPKNEPVFSFLVPVESKNGAVYFTNNMKINNYVSFDLDYRYDRIKYNPHYIAGTTPKIPDDMVGGLAKNFVPPYSKKEVPDVGPQPTLEEFDYDYVRAGKASKEWNKKNAEAQAIIEENKQIEAKNKLAKHQADIDSFAQPKKYSASSYSLASTIDPTDYLRLQLKYAKGFRVPTSDEVYFTFLHPDFTIVPNLDLQKETSKTQELSFTLHNKFGFISTSVFRTKYDNFIDFAFIGLKDIKNEHGGEATAKDTPIYQNKNMQNAKVTGLEINSRLNMEHIAKFLDGINLSYKFSYQKGKINGSIPMNALQPKTHVFGLGYNHSSGKFGVDLFVTHVSAKKASDTYNMFWEAQKAKEVAGNVPESERLIKDSSVRWRSKAYTLVDLIAYAKPIKNLTLQLGVYNLTNQKYITWDSARSIRPFGTSNLINQNTGQGINRFYAPGRNFKFNMEFVF
ncbi:TonB-dependent hemoglobin/transferrin/lactoferrin family receptor [Haemophilus haemoglobinophilus]|nr:TonB-dependent hemoglobin/transferrin/lactoferrin family receptor [Canicola haemoglobinophilus]